MANKMIKSNELRIGNLFLNDDNKVCPWMGEELEIKLWVRKINFQLKIK